MESIFTLLEKIRERPGMFVGATEHDPRLRLTALAHLLNGYAIAVGVHQVTEPVRDFPRAFRDYLRESRGWDGSGGAVDAVARAARNDADAWELFFALAEEFRATIETGYRPASPATSSSRSGARTSRTAAPARPKRRSRRPTVA
jgi:hypothetical protein